MALAPRVSSRIGAKRSLSFTTARRLPPAPISLRSWPSHPDAAPETAGESERFLTKSQNQSSDSISSTDREIAQAQNTSRTLRQKVCGSYSEVECHSECSIFMEIPLVATALSSGPTVAERRGKRWCKIARVDDFRAQPARSRTESAGWEASCSIPGRHPYGPGPWPHERNGHDRASGTRFKPPGLRHAL